MGITGKTALIQAAKNKFKRWIPATEAEVGDSRSAVARLSSGDFVAPQVTPKFRMRRSDKVFTIGSCFAREIETALVAEGCTVLTTQLNIDSSLLVKSGQVGNAPSSIRAILNKYSTSAILDEIQRALGNDRVGGFIDMGDSHFVDPHLSLLVPMSLVQLTAIRTEVNRIINLIREADVVFITLGLTETWKDLETGLYLNAAPP